MTRNQLLDESFPPEKKIRPELCCSAISKRSVNDILQSHFQKFADYTLPFDSSKVTLPHRLSYDAQIDEHGKIPKKYAVDLDIFPDNFQHVHREMYSKLLSDNLNCRSVATWRENPHLMPQQLDGAEPIRTGR